MCFTITVIADTFLLNRILHWVGWREKRHSSDILNHFTALLDKNWAALPSSLLLKNQKAVTNFLQKCFFLPTHSTPYMTDPVCDRKTHCLVRKKKNLSQKQTVATLEHKLHCDKSFTSSDKFSTRKGMLKTHTMWVLPQTWLKTYCLLAFNCCYQLQPSISCISKYILCILAYLMRSYFHF